MEMELTSKMGVLKQLKKSFDSNIDRFLVTPNGSSNTQKGSSDSTFHLFINNITSQFAQSYEVLAKLHDSVSVLEDAAVSTNVKSIDDFKPISVCIDISRSSTDY